MKHRTSLLALALSLLASCASPPTGARGVIDRHLDVSGTRERQYESIHSTATIEFVGMGISGTTETMQMKPSKMFTVLDMSLVGRVRSGFDGQVAWRIHPMMGEAILEGAELEQLLRRSATFRFPFKDPEGYDVIEFLGEVEFAGELCNKLRFVETPYPDMDLDESYPLREFVEYYSVETGLLVGTEGVAASPQGNIPSKLVISDYVEYGGSLVPGTVLIEAAGMTIKATTEAVDYDGVDPAVFKLPKEIEVLRNAQGEKKKLER